MKFPNFVPEAVCKSITARLDGDARVPMGYRGLLANVEVEIEGFQRSEEPVPDHLLVHRAAIARGIECLERLGHDGRMQEVYKLLKFEFSGEEFAPNCDAFVGAAWVARQNFASMRAAATSIDEWCQQVGQAAQALVELLRNPPLAEQSFPSALFHLGDLIESTGHPGGNRDFHAWQDLRPMLLAHPAWNIAPEPSELIRVLGTKASAHRSTPATEIARTALKSRQRNPKMEYLRAFAVTLLERGFDVQRPRIVEAMTIAADVALDVGPDAVVTTADVRRAVKKTQPEK